MAGDRVVVWRVTEWWYGGGQSGSMAGDRVVVWRVTEW